MRLILASASPRRAELLRAAGFSFQVFPVDVDERVRAGEAASDYVRRLATEKAALGFAKLSAPSESGRPPAFGVDLAVLGADTAVVVGDEILGKPRDAADAVRMLRLLSGRTHLVMTGVSLRTAAGYRSVVDTTAVTFAPLTDGQVAWYIASREGDDKAGGYAIQGLAARFVPRIEGSYTNVVGLPVAVVADLLGTLGGSEDVQYE